jgi:hypothetical protein
LAQWQAEAEERDKKKPKNINKLMVGAEGFEPPTLCSQNRSESLWKPVEVE